MQILIPITEKNEDVYTGRSPNLLGVSVTAKTRDEVETAILDEMEKRINHLRGLHSDRKTISRLPVEESISCVYEFEDEWRKDDGCAFAAQKDGLCWVHWKKLYSHAFGTTITLKACPLCGESNQEVLKRWDSPCPVKIENPNWVDLLEEKKRKMKAEWEKEKEQVRLEKLGNQARCSKMLASGKQCPKEIYRGSLCFSHSCKEQTGRRENEYRPESQSSQTNTNYFKNRFRKG